MPKIHICLRRGSKSQRVSLSSRQITIGRSPGNTIRLPFAWLSDQHLIIDNSPQLVRTRSTGTHARAFLADADLTDQWALLPEKAQLRIPAPDGEDLLIDLRYAQPHHNAAVLQSEEPDLRDLRDDLASSVVTPQAIDGHGWGEEASSSSAAAAVTKQSATMVTGKSWHKQRGYQVIGLLGITLVLALAVASFNQARRASDLAERKAAVALVRDNIAKAESLIRDKQYTLAMASLDQAEKAIAQCPDLQAEKQDIAFLRASPAIQLGAQGYVEMDGQWLKPDIARAWKEARERDDPKIEQLRQTAKAARWATKYDQARLACEESLAMMDKHPVQPHPRKAEITELLDAIRADSVVAEMTAKGMVRYKNKWVSPDEKFRLEQQDKGLVGYRGQWLTKDQAFAASQRDKGLVLHDGRWMTPDELKVAQGFVRFEGAWVMPEERDAVLAKRQEERRLERARAAEAARKIRERREREEQLALAAEKLKEDAYTMSQAFVKKILKAPATAKFQAYSSEEVAVVYKDGWFLVKGVVDSQNGFGAMLRSTYYCKLRPKSGAQAGVWETGGTFLDE